ncbi:MAG: hypothetical protein FH752_08925 [Marinobacter adhaerens]|uniref:Uncharacterized protein n=1 Tax=Marinobacter adhaerens TaxID=1033846 RepID=A0A844I158_9GAMM|nr:hypothetical protein [Marinobacter adhaerens]
MKKLTASQRFDRLRELEGRREDLTTAANSLNSRIQQSVGRKQKLEEDLRWETGERPPNAYSTRPARKGEIEQLKNDIQGLGLQIAELEKEYEPIRAELAEVEGEYSSLKNKPGKVTLADLRKAREAISKVSIEMARIEKASEEVGSRIPSADIENLKNQLEEAAAERDLLAAAVDLGEGSDADLKKASTKFAELKKQLAELEETASLAEATGRGYSHRLDRLADDKSVAEKEFSCLLTLYARELFEEDVKRLESALKEIEGALSGLIVANELSEQYGDGTVFAHMTYRARVELPQIPELETSSVEPQPETIEKQLAEFLEKIGKD